ncbi:MAG: hypothetical protein PVG38_17415 [Gammaproteobacteria bacterium]|jgi:hypothetical protein
MENYIVRIYGRDPDDPDRITGVLESVERETRHPFQSISALRSMLSAPAKCNLQPAKPLAARSVERHLELRPPRSDRKVNN